MGLNPQGTADLVTFTEEILNGKLHFLCSEYTEMNGNDWTPGVYTNSYLIFY